MALRVDITLTIDGTEVGYLSQASISESVEYLQAAAEEDYAWEDRLPGVRAWSATASVFVPLRGADDGLVALKTAMLSRVTVTTAMVMNGTTETGEAVVTGVALQASVGGALVGSISLKGTSSVATT